MLSVTVIIPPIRGFYYEKIEFYNFFSNYHILKTAFPCMDTLSGSAVMPRAEAACISACEGAIQDAV